MEISADIRRTDLVRFNWHLLPRERVNRAMVVIVALAVFGYLFIAHRPDDVAGIAIAVGASVAGGVSGLLAGFLITLTWILLMSSEDSGVLGKHHYVLSDAGLHESTAVNDGLHKWAGIQSIGQTRHYIFVRVNGYLFHLIPKRAFPSPRAAEEFWNRLEELWNKKNA